VKSGLLYFIAGVVAGLIIGFWQKGCSPVPVESVIHTRDSVVKYIIRTDTVRVPKIVRQNVYAERLDSTPCPQIEYKSDYQDTVHIIADCKNGLFPLIEVRPKPVIRYSVDTFISVRESIKEVKAFRPLLDVSAYGGHDVIRRVWGGGVSGGLHFYPLSLGVRAEYYNDISVRAEFHYTLLER
jgi:hypothetical protein